MSKRGRRRNSRRRKSSSSSKQSVSQCIFHKPNKNYSVCCEDDIAEKGETDSFRKEYALSKSEDEEKYNDSPPKEKRFKYDYQVNAFPNQGEIYTATTDDKEKGVKIITSVSVDDMEDSTPSITFQQSHEPLQPNPTNTSSATSIMKINCKGAHIKLQIQEHNAVGVKTTFVLFNEKQEDAETIFNRKCDSTCIPNNDRPLQSSPNWTIHSHCSPNFSFTFSSTNEPMEPQTHSHTVSSSAAWESPSSNQHCVDHNCHKSHSLEQPSLTNHKPRRERRHSGKSYSSDQSWDIPPPPREFADAKYNTLDELILGVASCRIGSCSPSDKQHLGLLKEYLNKSENPFSLEVGGRLDLEQLSDSDNYDPMSLRPSVSTNRSSFMKEFINCQKRKSWVRNNSIATVEHKACLLPKKRRQTFPRLTRTTGSLQEDHLMHFRDSFSSDTISSLTTCAHPQTQRQGSINEDDDKFPVMGSYNSSTDNKDDHVFVFTEPWRRQRDRTHVNMESIEIDDCGDPEDQGDVADSGFDQENGEVDCQSSSEPPTDELNRRSLAIQVIPPSCCGSVEQMLQSHPIYSQLDTRSSLGHKVDTDVNINSSDEVTEDSGLLPFRANSGDTSSFSSSVTGEMSDLHLETEVKDTDESQKTTFCLAVSSADTKLCVKENQSKPDEAENKTLYTAFSDTRELLKPVDGSACEHWARRRKLFKESRQKSSTGEGSITSDITEGSVSEESPSLDMTTQDSEEGAFYTETFHSAAWIYQGDNMAAGVIPAGLNTRSRAISIRERTVKINKGTGEYPWGFRIQFSKPIMVTEVDTNGAAEEAGLMVGDYVLAVNGTDVTCIPHSEAADLARQGPDILTLTIGSDIARGPNTPRPGCRGYLHKRTQSGLIKGWRKRWFVLTHDCCLHYHRHKRDEGKRQALSTIKLEGAEVGPDLSLGKPFVFKCRPLSGNRLYFFCATSNQEMKRWLDALEKAIHPVTQNHVWVDVTKHNSDLPPLAVKNPECLGLLHKIDKIKDTWVQHYCILKDGCLYLYSGIRATHAHGGIYLHGYTVREQPYGFKKSTIELKPPSDEFKTFYLCAENPNDNKRWIVAIKASITKWLPLHQALQDYNNRPPEETRM